MEAEEGPWELRREKGGGNLRGVDREGKALERTQNDLRQGSEDHLGNKFSW